MSTRLPRGRHPASQFNPVGNPKNFSRIDARSGSPILVPYREKSSSPFEDTRKARARSFRRSL